MFKIFTRKKEVTKILSPINGKVIDISEVKDQVFASKMMGDGVAIIPTNGEVYAPMSGRVSAFENIYHAIGITSEQGIDLMVHFGLDTVKYRENGFKLMVNNGQNVNVGEKVMEADIDFFKSENVDITTPILITNPVNFEIVNKCLNKKEVKIGDVLYEVKKK